MGMAEPSTPGGAGEPQRDDFMRADYHAAATRERQLHHQFMYRYLRP
eukprot:SAG31_NODE_1041_length_10203_cov_1.922902_5_plen_47_part_00